MLSTKSFVGQIIYKLETWLAIRANVGGAGDVLAWVVWVVCWRGLCLKVGGVGTWVAR